VNVAPVKRVGFDGHPDKGDPGIEFWGHSVCLPIRLAKLFPSGER